MAMTVSSSLHNLSSAYVLSILVMMLLLPLYHLVLLLLLLMVAHLRSHHVELLLLAYLVEAAVRVRADAVVCCIQFSNTDCAVVRVTRALSIMRGRETSTASRGASSGLKVLETSPKYLFIVRFDP